MNTSDKGNDKDKAGASDRAMSIAEASARIFAEQAAAMTAFGMSLTSRMTGIFMGAVADAIEKTPEEKAAAANPVERMARAPVQSGSAKSSPAAPVIKVADVGRANERPSAKPAAVQKAPFAEPAAEAPVTKPKVAKPVKPDGKVVQLRPATKKQTAKAKVAAKAEPAKEVVTAKKEAAPAPARTAKPARKIAAKAEVAAVKQPVKVAAPAKSSAVAKAKAADDLKQIPGIGPRLEKTLNDMGVVRLKQIAAWKADDIQKIDSELGLDNRITRDDWVGQAKTILKGSTD